MLENYSREMIHRVAFFEKRPKMKEFDCNNSVKFETAVHSFNGQFFGKRTAASYRQNKVSTLKWHSSSTDNIVLLQQSSNWLLMNDVDIDKCFEDSFYLTASFSVCSTLRMLIILLYYHYQVPSKFSCLL